MVRPGVREVERVAHEVLNVAGGDVIHGIRTTGAAETRRRLFVGRSTVNKLIPVPRKLPDVFFGTWERCHVGFDSEEVAEHGLCE